MPSDITDTVVTNGCFRCRIRAGMEKALPDLLAYMTTESWAVQMRSLARGSDGLAEINICDIDNVIIPKLKETARNAILPTINALINGREALGNQVKHLYEEGKLGYTIPKPRPSHIVLV